MNDSGQSLTEVLLWVSVLSLSALTFAKLSNLDYAKYREVIRAYSSKNTENSFYSDLRSSSGSWPTE